jgi:crotonobetainyl-CoA:carnitine CoA-transferase CaiB-like acyl-CoA transferase
MRRAVLSTSTADKPLAGITVLAFEQAVAAPLCTARLADAGARVIKVEREGVGDFARNYDKMVSYACCLYERRPVAFSARAPPHP